MKIQQGSSSSAAKVGASNSRRGSNATAMNHHQHIGHTALLDSLGGTLKDELRRGLFMLDSVVNQIAQVKWVLINFDKTLEDYYVDCPVCNATLKNPMPTSGSSSGGGGTKGKNNRLRVFPMVSGHTVQRPKINVTRIEQQNRKDSARAATGTAAVAGPSGAGPSSSTATTAAAPPAASQPVAGPSSRPTTTPKVKGLKVGAKRRGKAKRKTPIKKLPAAASVGATTRASAASTTETIEAATAVASGTPSTSQDFRLVDAGHTPFPGKRPGPKSKTQITCADMPNPPLLIREVDTDDVTIISNDKTSKSQNSSVSSTTSSPGKAPPVLTPYSSTEKLKMTSISLKREDGTSGTSGGSSSTPTAGESGKGSSSRLLFSNIATTSSASATGAAKRPVTSATIDSTIQSKIDKAAQAQADKKMKLDATVKIEPATTPPPTIKTETVTEKTPSMDDLLQLKYQKYRDQQRKRELLNKANAEKHANQTPTTTIASGCDDVIIIDGSPSTSASGPGSVANHNDTTLKIDLNTTDSIKVKEEEVAVVAIKEEPVPSTSSSSSATTTKEPDGKEGEEVAASGSDNNDGKQKEERFSYIKDQPVFSISDLSSLGIEVDEAELSPIDPKEIEL